MKRLCGALLALGLVVHAAPAGAVIIASGDGTGNTGAAPGSSGHLYAGKIGSLSGVYLGDGWVLTANHVGTGPVTLNGVTHAPVTGTAVRSTACAGDLDRSQALPHRDGSRAHAALHRDVHAADPHPVASLRQRPQPRRGRHLGGRERVRMGRRQRVPVGHQRGRADRLRRRHLRLARPLAPLRVRRRPADDARGDGGGRRLRRARLRGRDARSASSTRSTRSRGSRRRPRSTATRRSPRTWPSTATAILAVTAGRACGDGADDDGDGADRPRGPGLLRRHRRVRDERARAVRRRLRLRRRRARRLAGRSGLQGSLVALREPGVRRRRRQRRRRPDRLGRRPGRRNARPAVHDVLAQKRAARAGSASSSPSSRRSLARSAPPATPRARARSTSAARPGSEHRAPRAPRACW